ncbi:MAG TPA: hypothetical protein VNK51_00925 [Bradyrhizobium sp.]|nr:hypothetical protein [Bradyrhizobium sp.]
MAESSKLRKDLKDAGLSDQAIDAAWPTWWSEEADGSASARAELRFALARKLGVSPKALSDDHVEFVWHDTARFKHLSGEGAAQKAALASFGVAVAHLLLQGVGGGAAHPPPANDLRNAIREGGAPFVDLTSLLATCWGLGIPVIHLRVFPLATKAMHAMIVEANGRFAVLLGKDAQYPAPVAFTLAHELGHAALGHLNGASAIIDLDDPIESEQEDDDEKAADRYALALLTGSPEPDIQTNIDKFGARQLADAVKEAGPKRGIEPGTLALCYAYRTENWARAMAALRYIYTDRKPVWSEVNQVANGQIDWAAMSEDSAEFLRTIMGMPNG